MTAANEGNPYGPPSTDDCYRDPRLHYQFDLAFEFTEADFKTSVRRYANDHSLVVLVTLMSVLLPIAVIAYLEEFRGVDFSDLGFIAGGLLLIGFAASAWYLTTLPIRLLTKQRVQASRPLGLGFKHVRLLENTIEVVVDGDVFVFSLETAILKAVSPPRGMIVEFQRFEALCLPAVAFDNLPHQKEFLMALKKRIRNHSRVFWTTR